jgi:ribosomal protein S18 acetylase RimI-like enzyme
MMPGSSGAALYSEALTLEARLVPWDTQTLGFAVGEITAIAVRDSAAAAREFQRYEAWVREHCVRLVACRLPHSALAEGFFLEQRGFRFIEMTLHPRLEVIQASDVSDPGIAYAPASADDGVVLERIAESAFTNERIFMDPRLGPALSNRRYAAWLRNSLEGRTGQRVVKYMVDGTVVGFFIDATEGARRYWHLTAIAPKQRGVGLGKRVWAAAVRQARSEGALEIRTTIAARNSIVIGLYGRLGFRFDAPRMTFHWMR